MFDTLLEKLGKIEEGSYVDWKHRWILPNGRLVDAWGTHQTDAANYFRKKKQKISQTAFIVCYFYMKETGRIQVSDAMFDKGLPHRSITIGHNVSSAQLDTLKALVNNKSYYVECDTPVETGKNMVLPHSFKVKSYVQLKTALKKQGMLESVEMENGGELMESILESLEEDEEKEQFFEERTNNHIKLVQKAAKRIVDAYPEFEELISQAEKHDASKFEEPERTPYINLTWSKKLEKETGRKSDPSPEVKDATLHHVKSNTHHPEAHLENKEDANISDKDRDKLDKCVDASKMPDLDVAEMVADWVAMSEELGTNTPREWYNKQKDVRWHFSPEQDKLIDKLLSVFEKEKPE